MHTQHHEAAPQAGALCFTTSAPFPSEDLGRPLKEGAALRYRFPLCNETQCAALHKRALAMGVQQQLQHLAETYHDTPDFALLRASPGGWWLRYREIEGREEEGGWVLRMCQKATPEGHISYVDEEDEARILGGMAEIVPEAATAKTLFDMESLHIFSRLLTTRAHYSRDDLNLMIDCTQLAMNKFVLQGAVRAKTQEALGTISQGLVAAGVTTSQGVARSKVVEYVRHNNRQLYEKLQAWEVVSDDGFCEWHILTSPALVMSPNNYA
ncbi:uncharacterized protein ACA1_281310 [Acanthamoeba castellanii str. Neff]|uniref:Uncharacterized protein n=1 Tax=Acanthamoeba castellanii (strain ATCC 30010 / Neff) TaxID=1257118 RepID=L8H740_ACACF|nr:uncharacterized protein ACA1_281310 [Acanthamoeba castellanii str. Neff]ELR21037.1 hypothetical protein ACA1_281310 [Acanthamoeba castellanii str. Neff]